MAGSFGTVGYLILCLNRDFHDYGIDMISKSYNRINPVNPGSDKKIVVSIACQEALP
jgi:hypothetical protein